MADDQPVTTDLAEHFRRRVLLTVAGPAGGGPTEQLDIAMSLESSPTEIAEAVHVLAGEGLVALMGQERMLGQGEEEADVRLTGAGRSLVQRWQADGARRSKVRGACRAAVLSWLDELDGRHPSSVLEILSRPDGHYYGRPFTEDEISAACNDLVERGLIDANAAWGTGHILGPTITGRGADEVNRADGDAARLARLIIGGEEMERIGGTHITLTNSLGANVAAHSSGVSQSSYVMIDLAGHLERVVDDLKGLRGRLPAEDQATANQAIEGIIVERQADQPDRCRLERLLDDARQIWIGSMGTVGGAGALEVIRQTTDILQKLPLP